MTRNATQSAVSIHDLTVGYGPTPVLRDISAEIPRGVAVGVIGPNGGGKSTLLKAVLGFIRPDKGNVSIFGRRLSQVRGKIAYVPQSGDIDWDFPVTVREVAMMGRYGTLPFYREPGGKDRRLVDEALSAVRMDDYQNRQIGRLSGGQRQRVFLARALVQEAEILLLDEPFAGVDVATERAILDVLTQEKAKGRTIVVVHHDLNTAGEYFDRLMLVKNCLYAYGPTRAVLQKELLREVYEGDVRFGCDGYDILINEGRLFPEKR
ncbi:metal ABC transporter ATP-binding protein [Desulfovibrio inopinatus]|uniref:metal ABC transporter ATP-binding protein n=1 Tax=Desulfovibrio inopinatus TaxID=102109 RepID=UPI0004037C6A|nr:ABC transporter ATP-binding protein [Desulfovibrio inopinatus]